MYLLTSRFHAIIDYVVGAALIAAPWLFGFVDFDVYPAATWTPIVIGTLIIGMSLITDYEGGVFKVISFKTHLVMDALAAIFLAASPWLLNYAEYVYTPHLVVGIAELLIVFMTARTPYLSKYNMVKAEV